MAASEAQFKELVKRVEHLEMGLHRLGIAVEQGVTPATEVAEAELSEKERGLAALRRAGLLVDPRPTSWLQQRSGAGFPRKDGKEFKLN